MEKNTLILAKISIIFGFFYFCGFLHIVSYYAEFGFRFSDLNLQYYHIFYRGISMMTETPVFMVLLVLLMGALMAGEQRFSLNLNGWRLHISRLSEIAVVVAFLSALPLASNDGFAAALTDSLAKQSRLRELTSFSSADTRKEAAVRVLIDSEDPLLIVRKSSSELAVILAPDSSTRSVRVPLRTIKLGSGDYYEEKHNSMSGAE